MLSGFIGISIIFDIIWLILYKSYLGNNVEFNKIIYRLDRKFTIV